MADTPTSNLDPIIAAVTPLVASSPYGALAIAAVPLVESLLNKMFGGLNLGGTSVPLVTSGTPAVSSPDLVSVLLRIATALEGIEAKMK